MRTTAPRRTLVRARSLTGMRDARHEGMRPIAEAFVVTSALLFALPLGEARGQAEPTRAERLDRGPADMQMKLEKTFLGIDVATVKIWFGDETRARLRELAAGRSYSSGLATRIASTAIDADNAFVRLEFKRDVSLGQFLDGVRTNLERAQRAGILESDTVQQSWARVRRAFNPFSKRGFRDGDRITYRARGASLRTRVVSSNGRTLMDTTVENRTAPRTMLAGYFAPGSDFREPLIRSLLR